MMLLIATCRELILVHVLFSLSPSLYFWLYLFPLVHDLHPFSSLSFYYKTVKSTSYSSSSPHHVSKVSIEDLRLKHVNETFIGIVNLIHWRSRAYSIRLMESTYQCLLLKNDESCWNMLEVVKTCSNVVKHAKWLKTIQLGIFNRYLIMLYCAEWCWSVLNCAKD